jgi:hypothetical protein
VIRWFLVTFLALLIIGWLAPSLRKIGFGRLPGDFNFKIRGRHVSVPLASTILLSLLISLIAKAF